MYRMRGNADSASLFLDSVSRWCSLLARKQWVMLKPMDVNCQATGAWQYILFGSIKTALYPTRYNMSFWSVNIQLADPLPVFCRGVTLVGFVWLSASQISWSRMFAKHFIHPLKAVHSYFSRWSIFSAYQPGVWRHACIADAFEHPKCKF